MGTDTMKRLDLLMKIQAVVFLVYGVGFFFPQQWLVDFFKFDVVPTRLFVRGVGGLFIVMAAMEYLITRRLNERLDLVWAYAATPLLILALLIYDRTGTGASASDSFFWSSVVITVIFAAGVGYLRWSVKSS